MHSALRERQHTCSGSVLKALLSRPFAAWGLGAGCGLAGGAPNEKPVATLAGSKAERGSWGVGANPITTCWDAEGAAKPPVDGEDANDRLLPEVLNE